jgi:hypothetical protein
LSIAGGAAAALFARTVAANDGDNEFRRLAKGAWVWRIEGHSFPALREFALRHGIGRVMISLRPAQRQALLGGAMDLRQGVRALRESGVEVFALTGDPSWPRAPHRVPGSLAELVRIQELYSLFDGLHLDVEPHSLPEWRDGGEKRASLIEGLIEFLSRARGLVPRWPLEAALHPQYSRLARRSGETFMAALMEKVDAVSLMAYRDDAHRLIALAASSIEIFERASRPWRLGVLVHADKEAGTSYWGADRARLVSEMGLLDALAKSNRSGARHYRGLMFEDFDGLRLTLPG